MAKAADHTPNLASERTSATGGIANTLHGQHDTSMIANQTGYTIWAVANVIAAFIFIHLASWTWLEPNLRGEDVARDGDALVFMTGAFPVLAAALLINLLWVALIQREHRRTVTGRSVPIFIVVGAVWGCALVVNYLRSAGF